MRVAPATRAARSLRVVDFGDAVMPPRDVGGVAMFVDGWGSVVFVMVRLAGCWPRAPPALSVPGLKNRGLIVISLPRHIFS